jgi:hypothetical protein
VKDLNDPQRLLSAAARGSLLERGLTTARSRGPTDAELGALRASLFGGAAGAGALVERPASAGAAPAAKVGSAGWRALGLTKAATALVVASAIGGGAVLGWHRTHPGRVERPAQSASVPERKQAPEIAALVPAPVPTPIASPRRRSQTAVSMRPRVVAPIAPVASPASDADDELRLLGEAQRAVPRDPERALAIVREHERRYPGGLLAQEREAVAVAALWQVGRRVEARQRAERFAEEHPRSTYLGRMRNILAPSGDGIDTDERTDKEGDVPPSTVGGQK